MEDLEGDSRVPFGLQKSTNDRLNRTPCLGEPASMAHPQHALAKIFDGRARSFSKWAWFSQNGRGITNFVRVIITTPFQEILHPPLDTDLAFSSLTGKGHHVHMCA